MLTLRNIYLLVISFFIITPAFAEDLFLCKATNGIYQLLWNQPHDNSLVCEQRNVASRFENVIFTSISPKQKQNNNIILSGSFKDNIFMPTSLTEIINKKQNDMKNIDKESFITKYFSNLKLAFPKTLVNISMWNWENSTWYQSPEQFISKIKSKGINEVYLQLFIENNKIKNKEQLIQLLAFASQNQIKIIAVEGSPEMVTESGLQNAIGRNQIIKQFCIEYESQPCFAGIQYDIEPYILKGYNQDPNKIWQMWIHAVKKLSESWGDKIEIVIPFWLRKIDNGEQIVQNIKPYTSKYIVMAYRTDYLDIYNLSASWLYWGDKNEQRIIIALESGMLDDELEKLYVPNQQNGEIEKVSFTDKDVILLNKDKITSDNTLYAYSKSSLTKNQSISFLGQEDKLFQMVNLLSNIFTEWGSFDGFALHGLHIDK